jgi:ABC-type glutathione transport system ATPase component
VTGALIELANVRKSFTRGGLLSHRRVQAVDDVSFRIAADDPVIHTIIGESGSGKSTLARMILNITPPTSGSIVFRGRDLSTIRSGADRTAFMAAVQPIFQNPFEAFNPLKRLDHYLHVTARRFTGAKGQAVEQRTDEVLRQVGLSLAEVRGRFPHELSGGQLQRVAIARALVSRPALIVADEPVSMVDASLRVTVLGNLLQLKQDFGISLIYITHDLATAYQISDRIIVLHQGRVVEAGDPEQVVKHPEHPYTRLLIGSIPLPDPNRPWGEDAPGSDAILQVQA